MPSLEVVNLMRFRARRPFSWNGESYSQGDVVEIPEGHPRIEGMLMGRYIAYEAGDISPSKNPSPTIDITEIAKRAAGIS